MACGDGRAVYRGDGLARHGAHAFFGLLARTAATIAARALAGICLSHDMPQPRLTELT